MIKKVIMIVNGYRRRGWSFVYNLVVCVGSFLSPVLSFVTAKNSCHLSDSSTTFQAYPVEDIRLGNSLLIYQSWSYNVFDRDSDELKREMLLPFEYYECSALDEIRTLVDFVEMKMRKIPFHNFEHICSVLHFTFVLLTLGGGEEVFDESFRKVIYSILLSALLHDLEHPGNNNDYEVKTKSEIATRYNNESVLENHSLRMGMEKVIELDLLPKLGLAPDEIIYVQNEIQNTILYTDMSRHVELSNRLRELSNRWDRIKLHEEQLTDYDIQTFTYAIVHAADLNNVVQEDKEVAYKWARRIVAEFENQSRLEHEKGLQVRPFMSNLDSESARKVQTDFTSYVSPYFEDLAKILPNTKHFNDIIEENNKWWKDRLTEHNRENM
mmetsp:Transcript_7193/g.9337  ORF Transcript_7193/g.9337 Transcript_7193/m.9337 type:complete len:382 (-) Transcript_7193:609-1754(-)